MNGSASVACMAVREINGYQTNFPIRRDAGVQRGLDYLAIGDTHYSATLPRICPCRRFTRGAPEPTSFDNAGAGRVALVALFRRGRAPHRCRAGCFLAMDRRAVP